MFLCHKKRGRKNAITRGNFATENSSGLISLKAACPLHPYTQHAGCKSSFSSSNLAARRIQMDFVTLSPVTSHRSAWCTVQWFRASADRQFSSPVTPYSVNISVGQRKNDAWKFQHCQIVSDKMEISLKNCQFPSLNFSENLPRGSIYRLEIFQDKEFINFPNSKYFTGENLATHECW